LKDPEGYQVDAPQQLGVVNETVKEPEQLRNRKVMKRIKSIRQIDFGAQASMTCALEVTNLLTLLLNKTQNVSDIFSSTSTFKTIFRRHNHCCSFSQDLLYAFILQKNVFCPQLLLTGMLRRKHKLTVVT